MLPAIIGALGALGGGALGAKGAKDASKASSKSAQEQLAFQKWLYEQSVGRSEPWRATGQGALNMLAAMFGLPQSPYQSPNFSGGYGDQGTMMRRIGGKDAMASLTSGSISGIGSHGRKATFAPGQGQAFSAREVSRMLKKGMSVADIDKMGKLELTLNPHRLKKLMNKRGLTADQIERLQYGQGGPNANAMPGVLNPGDKGYQPFEMGDGPPGYNFFREEGQRDLGNSFAARGGAFSGNALKGLTEFNQEYANRNMISPLMQLAGFGQTAGGQQQSGANAYGAYGGNAMQSFGDARASGIANSANMWGQGLMGAANAFGNAYGNNNSPYDDYLYYGNQRNGT